MRILVYAVEEDKAATQKIEALRADWQHASRRNALLWEGVTERCQKVVIFPNPNADAIQTAYTGLDVSVEVISEDAKSENLETEKSDRAQAEKEHSESGLDKPIAKRGRPPLERK